MKAIIMAGGKGTRLKPLTSNIPKPMVPVINKPTMEYAIELCKKYNIDQLAITLAHLPNSIIDYFKEGHQWGVDISYYIEKVPLGTGGSVKNCEAFLKDTFLVISGDALTDIDLAKAIKYHKEKKSKATLILKEVEIPLEYGVVITDKEGRITRFMEKPSWGEVFSNCINTGMYILEPEILDYYNKGDVFDFSRDLFPRLLNDNIPIYGFITDAYWNDIGSMGSYVETHQDILSEQVEIKLPYNEESSGVFIGENTILKGDINIIPPIVIGNNCIIYHGSTIGPYTVIGDNCVIKEQATIEKTVLWDNCYIDKFSSIKGSVICDGNKIKKSVQIHENVAIGEKCIIEDWGVIRSDIKIWPHKKIEENTIVTQNLVWGTKISKKLFGFKDISGHINVEISPEFATRVGAAFASVFSQDSTIIVSCDEHNASNLIKNSVISGILSVGCSIIELSDGILPMTSIAITELGACAGIHIRKDLFDEDVIHMDFINEKGMNINRSIERDVENLFIRDDYKRTNAKGIKKVIYMDNYINHFIELGKRQIKNIPLMRKGNYKVLLSSKSRLIRDSLVQLFNDIGIEVIACEFDNYKLLNQRMKDDNSDMAVLIPEDGEKLILMDRKGRIIENEKYDAFILLMLLKEGKTKKMVIPHIMPNSIEEMVDKKEIEIIRSKTTPSKIMEDMKNIKGSSWLNQFVLTYNPIWAVGIIIDYFFEFQITLEELIDEIPIFYYVKHKLPCQLKDKGRVIREMFNYYEGEELELFEGIKITSEKGWTIVIPDSEKPQFNIFTEGTTEEYAEELSTFYQDKINQIIKQKPSN